MKKSLMLALAFGPGCLDYDLSKLQDLVDWCDSGEDCNDDSGEPSGNDTNSGSDSGGQGSDPPDDVVQMCTDIGAEPWGMLVVSTGGSEWTVWLCGCETFVNAYNQAGDALEQAEACAEQGLLEHAVETCNTETGAAANAAEVVAFWCGL